MSQALVPFEEKRSQQGRALALLNYGLLFASIFFAGLPFLAAAAIAYAQKRRASPEVRAHFRFQIGLFWSVFAVGVLAGLIGLSGLALAMMQLLSADSALWDAGWRFWSWEVGGGAVALMVGGAGLCLADAVYLMAGAALGFIRLASHQGLGKSRL